MCPRMAGGRGESLWLAFAFTQTLIALNHHPRLVIGGGGEILNAKSHPLALAEAKARAGDGREYSGGVIERNIKSLAQFDDQALPTETRNPKFEPQNPNSET